MIANPESEFADRRSAGRALAENLRQLNLAGDTVVLALPRGGVPVGYEISRSLGWSLELLLARKIGLPGNREVAMGAMASGGVRVLNQEIIDRAGVTGEQLDDALLRESIELERQERLYLGNRQCPGLAGRTVVVVDDGAATGATMWVAISVLRRLGVGEIIVALPVAAREAAETLMTEVDHLIALKVPELFTSVGQWYADFSQTTDHEVKSLLETAQLLSVVPA